jgi:hypothetical protein
MKIKEKIKNWHRGKPTPRVRIFIDTGKERVELPSNDIIYIQPPIIRLFNSIFRIAVSIVKFIKNEWKWVIPTAIAATALAVSLISLFANK